VLVIGLFAPLALKVSAPGFWMEVLLGGLMAGVLYSLVALGFVLIFKASGVFNFAQGAMVLFAALAGRAPVGEDAALGRAHPRGRDHDRARHGHRATDAASARQPGARRALMATLGVSYFLDGFGQTVWGSDIYKIELGIAREPVMILDNVFRGGILINRDDVAAAIVAVVLVGALALFFQKTATGRALRAVADDHQAAQSIGIPLNRIWVIVWSVAGVVAIVAGVIWGGKLGVQFSISLVALKALPVVILGGFTSVPGAIVGGLIIGVGEKMAEVFLGPPLVKAFDLAGGGIENWFAYMLALLFLLVRPEGLFGERHIDRV
jgi:branched-chain amino acid transport system permease protein